MIMSELKPFTKVEHNMLEAPDEEMTAEDYGCVDIDDTTAFIAGLIVIFSIIGFLTVLVGGGYIIIKILSLII